MSGNYTRYPAPSSNPSVAQAVNITEIAGNPVGPNNPLYVENIGYVTSDTIRLDYSSTNVDNSTWTEILASTSARSFKMTLFDSSGFAMELGAGAMGLEQRIFLIQPGGPSGEISIKIDPGVRLSVRAVGTTSVTAGEIDINLMG